MVLFFIIWLLVFFHTPQVQAGASTNMDKRWTLTTQDKTRSLYKTCFGYERSDMNQKTLLIILHTTNLFCHLCNIWEPQKYGQVLKTNPKFRCCKKFLTTAHHMANNHRDRSRLLLQLTSAGVDPNYPVKKQVNWVGENTVYVSLYGYEIISGNEILIVLFRHNLVFFTHCTHSQLAV